MNTRSFIYYEIRCNLLLTNFFIVIFCLILAFFRFFYILNFLNSGLTELYIFEDRSFKLWYNDYQFFIPCLTPQNSIINFKISNL